MDKAIKVQKEQLRKTIQFLRDRIDVLTASRKEVKQNYRNTKKEMDYWRERAAIHREQCNEYRTRISYLELPLWVKIKMYLI